MTYLSLKTVAEHTSLSTRRLRDWVSDPEDPLPAYRVGGKLLFKWVEVERWIRRHRVSAVPVDDILGGLPAEFDRG